MSICPIKFIPHEMKTTKIEVFSYQNKLLRGKLSNPYYKNGIVFENVMQFLLITEELLDALYFPQKSMELRHFSNSDNTGSQTFKTVAISDFNNSVPLASFEINIIFRQNASWQGNLIWLDKNTSTTFRSFMELLTLLDSVLSEEAVLMLPMEHHSTRQN